MQTLNSFISHPSFRQTRLPRILSSGLLWFTGLFVVAVCTVSADTISSNLTDASAGTETASGSNLLAASFGTGSSSATLEAVTLLLANSTAGAAEVDLYTNSLLGPGSLVTQLAPPATYSAILTDVNFTANGVTLAANSTYWVVLKATTGAFDWSWTADNTGTGIGYQGTWGTSTDGGNTWFTYAVFPTQLSVTTAETATAATPEPGTWILCAATLFIGAYFLRKKRNNLTAIEGQAI